MNILDFQNAKMTGKRIAMVTCYDYWTASLMAQTEIDCILVGDSLAMVMHGHATTLPATLEVMALHTEAVCRGAPGKFIVGDLPFLSFRKGLSEGITAMGQLMQAGASAVKLEGMRGNETLVQHGSESGIPIMVHLGMTPQSTHQLGGFRVQSRRESDAQRLIQDALQAQECGAFCLVLECVPAQVAREVTEAVTIPTIGIGAGPHTTGQVLVFQDLIGGNPHFKPKFLRTYANAAEMIHEALNAYAQDVHQQAFPSEQESYT